MENTSVPCLPVAQCGRNSSMQYCNRGDLSRNGLATVPSADLPHRKRLFAHTIYCTFGFGCLIPWMFVRAPSAVHKIASLSAVLHAMASMASLSSLAMASLQAPFLIPR